MTSYCDVTCVAVVLRTGEILADVVLIPVYVPISLTIARGFSAFMVGDFVDWMTKIKASVKALDATSIKPCMGIHSFVHSSIHSFIQSIHPFSSVDYTVL